MNINAPKAKNVYVPLAVIAMALVLMLVDVLSISNDASDDALEGLATISARIIMYVLVLLLGIGLCSWFVSLRRDSRLVAPTACCYFDRQYGAWYFRNCDRRFGRYVNKYRAISGFERLFL